MISVGLFIVAAFLNACMDVHQFHYYTSVFAHSTLDFFAPDGWKNKYVDRDPAKGRVEFEGVNIHPAFLDVWHFCKSGMVIMLCLAAVFYEPMFGNFWDIVILGVAWNVTFSLCWKWVLVKK